MSLATFFSLSTLCGNEGCVEKSSTNELPLNGFTIHNDDVAGDGAWADLFEIGLVWTLLEIFSKALISPPGFLVSFAPYSSALYSSSLLIPSLTKVAPRGTRIAATRRTIGEFLFLLFPPPSMPDQRAMVPM